MFYSDFFVKSGAHNIAIAIWQTQLGILRLKKQAAHSFPIPPYHNHNTRNKVCIGEDNKLHHI